MVMSPQYFRGDVIYDVVSSEHKKYVQFPKESG